MLQGRHQGCYTKGISPSTCVPTHACVTCPSLACDQKIHKSLHLTDSRTGSPACQPGYHRRLYCLTNSLCIARLALSHLEALCTCKHNLQLARSCHSDADQFCQITRSYFFQRELQFCLVSQAWSTRRSVAFFWA